jgi:hypothetical protein
MSDLSETSRSYDNNSHDTRPSYRTEQPCQGIIEHLKEEFGDYSDPMTYDWGKHETD